MILIKEGTALALVAAERQKQILRGWGPEGDDNLVNGELAKAAVAHTIAATALHLAAAGLHGAAGVLLQSAEENWPFPQRKWNEAGGWFPPDSPIENYVKAAAFLAAEIDRLIRLKQSPQ